MAKNVFDRLLDIGSSAVGNLANRATLGDDAATRIALARETEFYAGLNGSGPVDRAGYLADAGKGPVQYRSDPIAGSGVDPTGLNWQMLAVVVVVVLVAFIIVKKL